MTENFDNLSNELREYIILRGKERQDSKNEKHKFLIFSKGYTATQKISVANKIIDATNTTINFTIEELDILNNGRLGSIVNHFFKLKQLPHPLHDQLSNFKHAVLLSTFMI